MVRSNIFNWMQLEKAYLNVNFNLTFGAFTCSHLLTISTCFFFIFPPESKGKNSMTCIFCTGSTLFCFVLFWVKNLFCTFRLCLERNKPFVMKGKDSTFKHLMLASWWFHYWLLLSSLWAKNQTPLQLYKAALLDLFAIKFKSSFLPMTHLLAWDDFLLVLWRHLQMLREASNPHSVYSPQQYFAEFLHSLILVCVSVSPFFLAPFFPPLSFSLYVPPLCYLTHFPTGHRDHS